VTSLLTADDLYLFNQGTHYRLHDKLGAHVLPDHGGTYFAVWAPNAQAVSVIGDWNGWRAGVDRLTARESSGIWEGTCGVGHGARYKYAIVGPDGVSRDKADPVAARAEHPPATASVIWQPRYQWGDGEWMASRGPRQTKRAPISIYEAHLGSWRRRYNEVLGYYDLGDQLGAYLADLGFTHLELMPVTEHPFYGSWGYQVTGYFAATTRYGAPEDLMAMIDGLHRRGIGVIVDWVPAHFPTDAHGLAMFDGTHLYEHADPRRGFHPDWTSNIFNYGRHEVKSFLISSAMAWLDRYHVDGLRVDGVASMLYRDYSRKPGEWVPNEDGSNHDRDAIAFLQDFNRAVYAAHPDIQTIAEESTSWGGVTRPVDDGGLGFGYKWDLGWMHDTLGLLARDPIHRKHHQEALTFRSLYVNSENFVLPLSHDEVVHGKGSLLRKVHQADSWQRFATLRLLFGYQWTLPGKKLLFMGDELGVWNEWNHDVQLDWALADQPAHAGLARWVRDLNSAYRRCPALHRGDCEPWGWRWLVADDRESGVIAYARFSGQGDGGPVVVVANFTPVTRTGYRIGVPRAGYWKEILNSDAEIYGGSGVGNCGGLPSEPHPFRDHPQSLVVTAPPLGVVVFAAP
jgi:1,4-alpha-glucan branching enzyme